MKNEQIKKELQTIANAEENSIEKEVAIEALEYDEIKNFFSDLLNHGCVSGMIGSLIYYTDTSAFFDTYYQDIIWLKTDFEESIGTSMKIPHEIKNHLSWFAFEEVAYQLANKFELEI
jgi:hypothetical protein